MKVQQSANEMHHYSMTILKRNKIKYFRVKSIKFYSRNYKDSLKAIEAREEERLTKSQKDYLELEVRRLRRAKLLSYHRLERELLCEELNRRQAQLETAHAMLLRHHELTQELEYRQQRAVHMLREEQLRRQHQTELSNQHEYTQRAERELRKKHAVELKQQPKSLKQKEILIRKQFRETVKIQTRQYKALKAQVLASTPRDQQKSVIKKLKEDQRRKLALLGEQYEQSIAEMLQKQSVLIFVIFHFNFFLFTITILFIITIFIFLCYIILDTPG